MQRFEALVTAVDLEDRSWLGSHYCSPSWRIQSLVFWTSLILLILLAVALVTFAFVVSTAYISNLEVHSTFPSISSSRFTWLVLTHWKNMATPTPLGDGWWKNLAVGASTPSLVFGSSSFHGSMLMPTSRLKWSSNHSNPAISARSFIILISNLISPSRMTYLSKLYILNLNPNLSINPSPNPNRHLNQNFSRTEATHFSFRYFFAAFWSPQGETIIFPHFFHSHLAGHLVHFETQKKNLVSIYLNFLG